VKMFLIGVQQKQIIKLRTALEAGSTPLNEIKRPFGMVDRDYKAKLRRLEACEAKYKALMAEGLQKWAFNKNITG
jgi:hypothetical protein